MKLLTTRQLAEETGNAERTVRLWCQRLKFERTGRDYVLTEEQAQRIRELIRSTPGRPPISAEAEGRR